MKNNGFNGKTLKKIKKNRKIFRFELSGYVFEKNKNIGKTLLYKRVPIKQKNILKPEYS